MLRSPILRRALATVALLGGALVLPIGASDVASALVRFRSDVTASTALRVSSSVLRIDPQPGSTTGAILVGTVDYRAAARTRADGEVVLTVEAQSDVPALDGPGGGREAVIEFAGIGDGARGGVLRRAVPQVAGRWIGSGVRSGQLVFRLRGDAGAAGAVVPLRFVISLP